MKKIEKMKLTNSLKKFLKANGIRQNDFRIAADAGEIELYKCETIEELKLYGGDKIDDFYIIKPIQKQ